MLGYTEIKPNLVIDLDGEPYVVLSTSGVVKKQRQKPHNTAKMRGIRNGSIIEKVFVQSDKIEEADMGTREITYLYTNRGESWFCTLGDPKDRFVLSHDIAGDAIKFIRPNDSIEATVFDDTIIGLILPVKVELKVTEAPPNVRGNTAQGGTKPVTLETGLIVNTPLFVEVGDTIRVNTETGMYAERVQK